MFAAPSQFRARATTQYLLPPAGFPDESRTMQFPALVPGEAMLSRVHTDIFQDWPREFDPARLVRAGPCSLDVLLSRFTKMRGAELAFPIEISRGERIVGKSGLLYSPLDLNGSSLVCVETRSRAARFGLVCLGFADRGVYNPFRRYLTNLDFVLENMESDPLVIEGPISPVQITDVQNIDRFLSAKMRISDGDRAVRPIGTAYPVHLHEAAAYRPATGAAHVLETIDDGFTIDPDDARLRHVSIDELPLDIPYSLTLTREEIDTNGEPAYMFPFHARDAGAFLNWPERYVENYRLAFEAARFMPVTGNAGLINPGTRGRIVCENVMRGDVARYFSEDTPFALIMPVPFVDGRTDTESYRGAHRGQNQIII